MGKCGARAWAVLAALAHLGCGGLARDPEGDEVLGTTRLDQLLQALRADVAAAAADDRPFFRYVTLMDRHDAYAAALASPALGQAFPAGSSCDSAKPYDLCDVLSGDVRTAADLNRLEAERHAISKAANSVSRQPRSAIPRAIDGERLIYRLDLRDYGWATPVSVDGREYRDGWEAIAAHAKLALELEGEDADAVKEATGAAVPFLLSRVFIDTATLGDVYYGLLRLPSTLTALENELGVANGIGVAGAGVRRAFTDRSGISRQPRVLERRGMPDGDAGYWLAYDFLSDENAASLFTDPLGSIPADAMHAMFPLPNGLHAFYSTDASGRRLTTSPVLESPPDEDGRAHNAASCFGCHQRGAIQFTEDDLLARVDAAGNVGYRERDAIADVYVSFEDLLSAVDADNDAYAAAVARAGLSYEERDPVSIVYFEFQSVHRFAAAGELFVAPELLSARLAELPPALAPLAAETGSVERAPFADAYRAALCTLLGKARNRPLRCP
jgi:hypothetical protein